MFHLSVKTISRAMLVSNIMCHPKFIFKLTSSWTWFNQKWNIGILFIYNKYILSIGFSPAISLIYSVCEIYFVERKL